MNEWFDGKTIAVIGNAQSLFKKNYGEEIDSHDVVIRINRGIQTCFDNKAILSHGIKLNVWTFNMYRSLETFDNLAKTKISQTYKKIQMFYEINNKNFDDCLPKDYHIEIAKEFQNKKVTTGLRTLHLVSKFNTKQVSVYGFDWKETPTFYNNRAKIQDNIDHDYAKEKQYCMDQYFKTGKFTLKN